MTDDAEDITIQALEVQLEKSGRTLTLNVHVAFPSNAGKRLPTVVQGAFPSGFGRQDSSVPSRHFSADTNRGYAVAELDLLQLAADTTGLGRAGGVCELSGGETDCGSLTALIALRGLLSLEGTLDDCTNPEGVQLTYQEAQKVCGFLQAGYKLSILYRAVGHTANIDDLLAYPDHLFYGKRLSAEYGRPPYKDETQGFSWDMPR